MLTFNEEAESRLILINISKISVLDMKKIEKQFIFRNLPKEIKITFKNSALCRPTFKHL